MTPRLCLDISREPRPGVVHGQDDAVEGQGRMEMVAHEVDGGQQLCGSLQGVVLTLKRDEDRIGGGQGIHGQEPE
jgi:hypothetical protein